MWLENVLTILLLFNSIVVVFYDIRFVVDDSNDIGNIRFLGSRIRYGNAILLVGVCAVLMYQHFKASAFLEVEFPMFWEIFRDIGPVVACLLLGLSMLYRYWKDASVRKTKEEDSPSSE